MTTVVEQDPVVAAVVAQVATTGFPVGDGQAPAGDDMPYAVVYSIPDFSRSGPWSDGQADTVHQIQITYVGETREQASQLADKGRAVMAAGVAVPGRRVSLVDLAPGGGGSVERDDDSSPPLFYAVDIYRIYTTPV